MITVNYPKPDFRIEEKEGKKNIFDNIRKNWVLLTPEEWVRQNFIQFLIQEKKYPAAQISLEKVVQLGELKKRFDVLVYNKKYQPWMLIECKASEIKLDEKVLQQILRYHISIPATYLVITNGQTTYGWKKRDNKFIEINELDEWE